MLNIFVEDRISALITKDPNKLSVYLYGYDGHSLRAYAYFGNQMPDIELAQENEKCYSAKVGTSDIMWKASDTINYQGKQYTGEEFYELVTNQKL